MLLGVDRAVRQRASAPWHMYHTGYTHPYYALDGSERQYLKECGQKQPALIPGFSKIRRIVS